MKKVWELENPDIIEINGGNFQVLQHTSLWYDSKKDEMQLVIELTKLGNKKITSDYRIIYIDKKPDEWKFSAFDKKSRNSKK